MIRLIDHLKTLGLSNREARKALSSGKVLLRGCPTGDAGRDVEPAEVQYRPNAPSVVIGRDPFVLFHDPSLAILWKPSGMLSVPAPHRHDETNLIAFAGRLFGHAYPVHRLDEETSGLMMVALKPETQDALKLQLERHEVDRRYLALVQGRFPETAAVRNTLVRDRGDGLRGSGPGGKPAATQFRRLEALQGATLVEARLETGRTHQVRIHLTELGHGVLGDPLYGNRGSAPRLALHAWRLAFKHPFGGKEVRVEVPLADDLERLRRELSLDPAVAGRAE